MHTIKSILFYFLALRSKILKTLKRIYFSTDFYNKSLISKTPQQFYFHPNPFLLSAITSYKKYSFKISEIDQNIVWKKNINKRQEREIHEFLWLNLIDRKNDGKSIQKIIRGWINRNEKFKYNIWANSILSKRIISWILNVDIILNNGTFDFKKSFLDSIICQTNHLKKNIRSEDDYSNKVEIITALILSGLVFKEYNDNFEFGLKELEKVVKNFFDNEGFPLTRNPNDLVFFLKYLILNKECIKDAQKYVPEFLEIIIKKNLVCLKNVLTPGNQVPLFNGGTEENLENFTKFLNDLSYNASDKKKIVGGLTIIKHKDNLIFFDIGGPPKKNFSKTYQSGPLSFEYYYSKRKIITNCGFGSNFSPKTKFYSRLTSAQTTITLNDTSISKFEKNEILNKNYGALVKNNFKITNLDLVDNNIEKSSSASHNGYEKKFGCIHKRKICISKKTEKIVGYDVLMKKDDSKPINFALRFHLYPGITAVKTISGNSVLIRINKNRSLLFFVKDEKIILEKSIFLGGNKILNNTCITVAGILGDKNKTIHWEIKKNTDE